MSHMFDGLRSATQLILGTKFNTAAVTDMSYMFNECSTITSLDLGLYFDTSRVTNMDHMFNDCSGLQALDLKSSFYTSNVTNMNYMFCNCRFNSGQNYGLHLNGNFVFSANLTTYTNMFRNVFTASGGEMYLTSAAMTWIQTHNTGIANVHYNTI